jgi:O-antigen/teichoic acid export membrane protein
VRPAYASDFVGGIFALRAVLAGALLLAMLVTLLLTGRSHEILVATLVFGVGFFFASINGTLSAVLQAVSQVGRLALSNVLSKVIWGVGLTVGLFCNAPMWMLALPMVGAELAKTLVMVPAATIAASLRYRINARAALHALRDSVPFFVNSVAITFGNYLALSALEFIRRDEREVGWFAASQNVAGLATLLYPLLASVVTPMLSRAQGRSSAEMMTILRRALEGLLIVTAPGTVFISAGADVLINLAFGAKYAPAATGLSILSLVFLMTYMNFMLAVGLILSGRGWSVTLVSIGSVFGLATLMLILVPVGRSLLATGGECAGAAAAVIASEACAVVALLLQYAESPLDPRNVSVLIKSAGISAVVLTLNHFLFDLGAVRLVAVMLLYVGLGWALRVIKPAEVVWAIRMMRTSRGGLPETAGPHAIG